MRQQSAPTGQQSRPVKAGGYLWPFSSTLVLLVLLVTAAIAPGSPHVAKPAAHPASSAHQMGATSTRDIAAILYKYSLEQGDGRDGVVAHVAAFVRNSGSHSLHYTRPLHF